METHGVYAAARVERVARAQRRRFLARSRITVADLNGVQLAYLSSWAACAAKCELIDRYCQEHGLIRDDGTPQPVLAVYMTLQNSARCAMQRLEASLRADQRGGEPSMVAVLQGHARRVNGTT